MEDYKADLLAWEKVMIEQGHKKLVRKLTLKALKLLPTPRKKKVRGKKTAVKKATTTKTSSKTTKTKSPTDKSVVAKKTKNTPAKKTKALADTTSHYLSSTDSDSD